MSEVEALLLILAGVDRQLAAYCAASCVQTVLPGGLSLEDRLQQFLSTRTLPNDAREVVQIARRAASACERCSYSYHGYDVWDYVHEPSDLTSACTCRAIACVYETAWKSSAPAEAAAYTAAAHAVRIASAQHPLYSAAWRDSWSRVFRDHLDRLHVRVWALRWPRLVPTREQIVAAEPVLAVLWDELAHVEGALSLPALLQAHARAAGLGLSWSDPVQRAIAERLPEPAQLVELLCSRR